jgi:hydrogenase maturation protease
MTHAQTLVVGLGNPILGDDGVGWRVAQDIEARCTDPDVEVACLALGGMALMERLVGYRRALIVDAMTTGTAPGSVISVPLDALAHPAAGHTASSHDTSLATALALGRRLGAELPDDVWVVAIEAERLFEFSAGLSAAVATAMPEALRCVEAWLRGSHAAPACAEQDNLDSMCRAAGNRAPGRA